MKNFILLFAFSLFANISNAQDSIIHKISNSIDSGKIAVKESINAIDTSSNFKQIYSDIKTGITALASSLKIGAEHVYEVLVKQQIVNAIVYLLLFIISIYLILNWIKNYKNKEENWLSRTGQEPSGLGIIRMIQVIFGLILFLIGIFHIDNIIMGFVNPEYGAIKDIIDIVAKK